jgi:hypothetical protein
LEMEGECGKEFVDDALLVQWMMLIIE